MEVSMSFLSLIDDIYSVLCIEWLDFVDVCRLGIVLSVNSRQKRWLSRIFREEFLLSTMPKRLVYRHSNLVLWLVKSHIRLTEEVFTNLIWTATAAVNFIAITATTKYPVRNFAEQSCLKPSRYLLLTKVGEPCESFAVKLVGSQLVSRILCVHFNGCDKLSRNGITTIITICHNLTHLTLQNCIHLCDTLVENICNTCLQLQGLNISFNTQLTNRSLRAVLQTTQKRITHLDISGCSSFTGSFLSPDLIQQQKATMGDCHHLMQLKFRSCSDSLVKFLMGSTYLSHFHRNLSCINVANNSVVTVCMLDCLSRNCYSLTSVSIDGCENALSGGILALLMNCKQLAHLSMANLVNVSDNTAEHIAVHGRSLESLNIIGCTRISQYGVMQIVRMLPKLSCIYLDSGVLSPASVEDISDKTALVTIVQVPAVPVAKETDSELGVREGLMKSLQQPCVDEEVRERAR